ncbi:hypothetical protein LCGC14_2444280, partial [marine sediment metagenome]
MPLFVQAKRYSNHLADPPKWRG